ncbi:MAG: RluA family pseudouridine synthase [Waddliaceae bacterium]
MDQAENEVISITADEAELRLDKILANRYRGWYSRSYFQALIQDNHVTVNGAPVKKRVRAEFGDQVKIFFVPPPEIDLAPEPIPLTIIYEDEDLLVVNKSAGMVIHPAPGNWSGTFVNALLHHTKSLPSDSPQRPGIVHRLDKETTGVLIAAKTTIAQERLTALFAKREIYKEYWAICLGNPGEGEMTLPIGRHPVLRKQMTVKEGGRPAKTQYKTLAFNGIFSLVKVVPTTGRTHQIRVHMKNRGHPILGDAVYGSCSENLRYQVCRQFLHAKCLRFNHPITGEFVEFFADLPEDMGGFILKEALLPNETCLSESENSKSCG